MPEQIGIRELRDRLTATIRRVRNGETIEITHRGRPVATLTPVRTDQIDRLPDAADLTPAVGRARSPRRFAPVGKLTASAALQEDRAERSGYCGNQQP